MIVAYCGEDGVVCVAAAVVEIIAAHPVLVLEVADNRFDCGPAAHLSFDRSCDATLLPSGEDLEAVIGRRIVAAIASVGHDTFERIADKLLHGRDDASERVPIIRVAGQCLHVSDELAALAMFERGCDAHLDAELIRLVRFTLADALHFGRVQAVDFRATLSAFLSAHVAR